MRCYECGEKATEKHHMIPKSLGGTKTIDLCSACHCKVHGFNGERINAVELSQFGVYRSNPISFIAVLAWDKDYSYNRWKVDYTKRSWPTKMAKHNYNSYLIFSGDYKTSQKQFENRYDVISKWAAQKKWEWFDKIAQHEGYIGRSIVIRILNDKYRVKTYNKEYKKTLLPMVEKHDWVLNTYEDRVMHNIYHNLDVTESRYSYKRKIYDDESKFYKQRDEAKKMRNDMRFLGSLFFGIQS